MRLDQYLAQYFPEYSRSQWQKFVALGYVKVNGQSVTQTKYQLDEDDHVTYTLPKPADTSKQALPVLFEDDDVLVINKPRGVLTHSKGALNEEFTVADFVRPRTSDQPDGNRPGIVHRLDRATSGILIAAKSSEAKRFLQKQFQDRKAKKTYLALVQGTPKQPEAIIKLPIERNPKQPQSFRVGASGKYAETAYRTLASYDSGRYSLLELKPVTGRTHQLRVHLAHIGTPIVGDELYGGEADEQLFLHAAGLEITLPTRERRTFEAPLPPELMARLERLVKDRGAA